MSEMNVNSNPSQLTPEMVAMIEEKRRLAVEKRNKRQLNVESTQTKSQSVVPNQTNKSQTIFPNQQKSKSFLSRPQPFAAKPAATFSKPSLTKPSATFPNPSRTKPLTNIKEKSSSVESPNKKTKSKDSSKEQNVNKIKLNASMRLVSNKRYEVIIEYNSDVIAIFRRIESRDWNPNTKIWSFDIKDYKKMMIELNTISSVSIQFTDSIPDRVMNALIDARNKPKETIDLSERLGPQLTERLYDFQKEGIQFGVRTGGRCLIADDMGLGKTMQAIGIAQWFRDDWPLLIVCPSSLRYQWRDSIIQWLPNIKEKDILVIKQVNENLPQISITIISYDLLARMRSKFSLECKQLYDIIILDESHYIKSDAAARTEAVHLLARSAKRIILLTGTPALSRPMELFSQIKLIDSKLFSSKHEFGVRYCDAQLMDLWRGRRPHKVWDYKGAKNLDELKIILESTLLVRRLKTEVLHQLTKKKREMILIHVNHLSDKELNKLKNYSTIVKKLKFKGTENTSLFDWYMDSAFAKVEPVSNYLEQLLNKNIKLICFCHHKQMMDGIQEVLAKKLINHIRIDGSTPALDRQEACEEFQTKPNCRVALLSITACATGLNLTAASTVVFAELFWNPGILSQAEDRIYRIGQTQDVKIYYLVAKNTIDDMIWPLISKKLEVLNKAGLSKDNFEEQTNILNAFDSEQRLITEFLSSLDDNDRKALMEDNISDDN